MRTTLIISDELLASAKRLAAERRCSLSAVVEEALRKSLKPGARKKDAEDAPPFQLPIFRGRGSAVDTSPAKLAELRDNEDLEPYRN